MTCAFGDISETVLLVYLCYIKCNTVNVDVERVYIFREFAKIDNFAWIYIRIFHNIAFTWHRPPNKSCFHVVHIFLDISKTRITRKCVQRENVYVHSSTFVSFLWYECIVISCASK